jgi:serine/threonine-protein kinase
VAHQNNLFHGLVKPSNIMVGSDNQARILDFGIGSLLVENEGESLVDTMSTANTLTSGLDCASPESIMEPTNRTPAGDQYSLGCVLYYCLTGRVPFPEGSAVEKMMAHQTKEPVAVQEFAPDVPADLAAVVKKLMAKTPEERYSGCDELVEALEPFLGNLQEMPGGVAAMSGGGSSGGMAGLRSGGYPGIGNRAPGTGSGSRPAATLPSRSGQNPSQPPAGPNFGAKTPQPQPARVSPHLPSRASFQLPPMADEIDTGSTAQGHTPTEMPSQTRGAPAGWVDEPAPRARGNFGPVGLIVAAVLIMVAVYFGATQLMK